MEEIKLMPDPLDIREITFTNILLLGFDVEAKEYEYGIQFNRDMFVTPNIKGMEVLLHFLFTKIKGDLAKELFRGCWPVKDRKQAQEFRKVSLDWLNKIKREDPNCFIPNISPAILLSPSGNRFYQFMFYLSLHVLKLKTSIIPKKFGVVPTRPTITSATKNHTHQASRAHDLAFISKSKKLVDFVEETTHVKNTWIEYASELSKKHRKLNKRKRECEKLMTEVEEKIQLKFGKRSVSSKDILKRSEDLIKVAETWKTISKFYDAHQGLFEQVQDILSNKNEEHVLDGADINFKIPDILVRECEKQLHLGNKYENIYEGGKVDLSSLVNLWNLGLHQIKDALTEFPLPNVAHDVAYIQAEAHKHGNNLNNTISVKHMLQDQISDLTMSIDVLRERLQNNTSKNEVSPARLPENFRLDILPSTPTLLFQPISDDAQFDIKTNLSSEKTVDTPDAVQRLLDKVNNTVQKDGTPINPTIAKLIAENKKPSKVTKESTKPSHQSNLISSKIPTWKQRKQELSKESTNKTVTMETKRSNMAAAQQILIEQIAESVISNEKGNDEAMNLDLHAFEKPFEAFRSDIFQHQDKVMRTPQKTAIETDLPVTPAMKDVGSSPLTPINRDFFTPLNGVFEKSSDGDEAAIKSEPAIGKENLLFSPFCDKEESVETKKKHVHFEDVEPIVTPLSNDGEQVALTPSTKNTELSGITPTTKNTELSIITPLPKSFTDPLITSKDPFSPLPKDLLPVQTDFARQIDVLRVEGEPGGASNEGNDNLLLSFDDDVLIGQVGTAKTIETVEENVLSPDIQSYLSQTTRTNEPQKQPITALYDDLFVSFDDRDDVIDNITDEVTKEVPRQEEEKLEEEEEEEEENCGQQGADETFKKPTSIFKPFQTPESIAHPIITPLNKEGIAHPIITPFHKEGISHPDTTPLHKESITPLHKESIIHPIITSLHKEGIDHPIITPLHKESIAHPIITPLHKEFITPLHKEFTTPLHRKRYAAVEATAHHQIKEEATAHHQIIKEEEVHLSRNCSLFSPLDDEYANSSATPTRRVDLSTSLFGETPQFTNVNDYTLLTPEQKDPRTLREKFSAADFNWSAFS